ncbi:hypothetical protein LTS18_008284 [Coniosporium uncinatum]|uniref:Uncharacterized protein n=1 Tax=Coniosporium uncinatum TaxID=93489 RepID=A0ACC3DNL9_9PEZI|nr:hypothetical protein LTS18_008284 [Coniosporium uncinatum]
MYTAGSAPLAAGSFTRRCPPCRSEGLAFIHQFACCEEIPKELRLDASLIRLCEPEDAGNGYAVEDEESDEEYTDCPYRWDDNDPCLNCSTLPNGISCLQFFEQCRDSPESEETKAELLDYNARTYIEGALECGNADELVSQYCKIILATDAQSWNGRMLDKDDFVGRTKDDEFLESDEEEWYLEPNLYGYVKPGVVRMIVPDQVWQELQAQYLNGVPKVAFRCLVDEGLLMKYA